MVNNWQIKKLDEVCFFQEGPGIRKYEYKKGGYPIINVRCVQDGFIDLSNSQAVDPKFIKEKWGHFQVEEDDILFTTSGSIGRTAMVKKEDLPLLMNTSVVRFKSLNQKELDKNFLAWLLRSPNFIDEVKSYSSGTAQKNVGPTHLKMMSISFPSLPEQKRIVKTLDEVFNKIEKAKENAEKNLQNSKVLFDSYLQDIFINKGKDWEEKSLEELGQITSSKRIYKKEYVGDGVPFYRIKEIKELAHDKNITIELFISDKRYKEIKDVFGVPMIGDILMTAVGTIGEIYVVKNDDAFYFKDGNILWFKNFNSVDPYFLKFVLISFVEQINKLSKGSAYSALTIEKIEKHKIFLPKTLSEQKAIVKKLDELSNKTKKLEVIYMKKLADLEEFKKSVLKKAFSGEL